MNSQEELIERLTHFYREAGGEVSSMPPAWAPGKPRWLQPALANFALVALVIGLAVTIRIVRLEGRPHVTSGPPPIVSPSLGPSSSAGPSPSPSLSATPSWITLQVPIGSVVAMSLDSSAVYALYDPGPMNGRPVPAKTMLARIDRATAAVTTAGPFGNATLLARVAPGLWIGAGADQGTPGDDTQWLTLVDPVTLKVKQRIHLPGRPTAGTYSLPRLDGEADMLWLGYGNLLYRLDPGTGRLLLTQRLPGTAASVSIDSLGHRLYVGVDPTAPQNDQALVLELDARTGAQLASAPTGGAGLGGPQVTAAPEGVWIAFATGMMGAVEHRRVTDLTLFPEPQQDRHANTIRVSVGGGALWLVDAMASQVACADVRTGTIAASVQATSPGIVIADSAGSYLGDNDGVNFLRPDPSCPH